MDYCTPKKRATWGLTKRDLEKQFEVGKKQAKRELTALAAAGLVHFVARRRPEHYELTEAGAAACEGSR